MGKPKHRLAEDVSFEGSASESSTEADDEQVWALLSELQAHRIGLAGIDKYCGNEVSPGGEDPPGWREWTAIETTSDQRRIEDWLLTRPTEGRRILHIGVGNSSLARRLDGRVAEIVGTTIYPREKDVAESLRLKNYSVHVLNKYSSGMRGLDGKFDFIIDNNPSSYTCCLFHFCRMLRSYRGLLKTDGEWLTAEPGLGMVLPGRDPHWALDWEQWASLAHILGLHAVTRTPMVYAMVNGPVPEAAAKPRSGARPVPGGPASGGVVNREAARALMPALETRLDELIGELSQTRETLAAQLRTRALTRQRLAALFALPCTDGPRPLTPYEEISPGIRVGFAPDMTLALAVERRPEAHVGPAGFRNRVRLVSGGRGWFALEIRVAAAEFVGAGGCQLAFCIGSTRPLGCSALLRWSQDGRTQDTPLRKFSLNPQEYNYNFACRFPPVTNDPAHPIGEGLVVVLFDTGSQTELEFDYASLYFV